MRRVALLRGHLQTAHSSATRRHLRTAHSSAVRDSPSLSGSLSDMQPGSGSPLTFLHSMIRVYDLAAAQQFFSTLGLVETRRVDVKAAKFTLVFMATSPGEPEIELTYNYDPETPYTEGRNFGHLAYACDNIYDLCAKLSDSGVKILRPPHDGRMAFVRSPDNISVELLQKGNPLPAAEPWKSMKNSGGARRKSASR